MGRVAQPSAHPPPPLPLLITGVTSPPISRLYSPQSSCAHLICVMCLFLYLLQVLLSIALLRPSLVSLPLQGPLHGVSSAVLVVCCSVSSVCSCFISSVNGAKAIKKGAISLKQQACHVRPAAVMGAMAAANAVRGGGREGALKAPLLVFSPLAGASSWGVLCRSCYLL